MVSLFNIIVTLVIFFSKKKDQSLFVQRIQEWISISGGLFGDCFSER